MWMGGKGVILVVLLILPLYNSGLEHISERGKEGFPKIEREVASVKKIERSNYS